MDRGNLILRSHVLNYTFDAKSLKGFDLILDDAPAVKNVFRIGGEMKVVKDISGIHFFVHNHLEYSYKVFIIFIIPILILFSSTNSNKILK